MNKKRINYGANVSWNKKERVYALLQERNPLRRPTNPDEVGACAKWNQFAKIAESYGKTLGQYLGSDEEEWFKERVRAYREARDTNYRGGGYVQIEDERVLREEQGGSRKKGGRVSWPRKMK